MKRIKRWLEQPFIKIRAKDWDTNHELHQWEIPRWKVYGGLLLIMLLLRALIH